MGSLYCTASFNGLASAVPQSASEMRALPGTCSRGRSVRNNRKRFFSLRLAIFPQRVSFLNCADCLCKSQQLEQAIEYFEGTDLHQDMSDTSYSDTRATI